MKVFQRSWILPGAGISHCLKWHFGHSFPSTKPYSLSSVPFSNTSSITTTFTRSQPQKSNAKPCKWGIPSTKWAPLPSPWSRTSLKIHFHHKYPLIWLNRSWRGARILTSQPTYSFFGLINSRFSAQWSELPHFRGNLGKLQTVFP